MQSPELNYDALQFLIFFEIFFYLDETLSIHFLCKKMQSQICNRKWLNFFHKINFLNYLHFLDEIYDFLNLFFDSKILTN